MIRKRQCRKRVTALGLTVLMGMTALGGCGKNTQTQAIPELLEPIEITLTGKKVARGDIQDIEAFKGSVKAESISYAFSQGCKVEDMTVHVGQYIQKGDLIAKVNTSDYEKELADLNAEISYLEALNRIETQLFDIQIEADMVDLNGIPSGSDWYEEAEKALEAKKQQRDFDIKERELNIKQKRAELTAARSKSGSSDIYASENGYLTYVKDFSVDNPTGYINANEIVAVASKENSYYISSTMPLVTAREAEVLYAEIAGKRYELSYKPYEESELKQAANNGVTLESRFLCEEDLSGLMGSEVTVYAVSNYRKDVLSVSADAFFSENNTDFVYLLKDGEKVKQEVEDGVHTKNAVEIISGLSEGDEVYCQATDIPGSDYRLVTVERSKLDITKRYDTAKTAYTMVSQVVNTVPGAKVKEVRVKNGNEVKAGDIIAVLEAGSGNSAALDNSVEMTALKRNYDYEMSLYRTELEELSKRERDMVENETTSTSVYKKLVLEIRSLKLKMEKEQANYEYETGRLNRNYAQNLKENGEIYLRAKRAGIVRELASLSEGYTLDKDSPVCKIVDSSFACVKLFTNGTKIPVGSKVSIVKGSKDEPIAGKVVASYPEAAGTVYEQGCYLVERSSQTSDATYILLEDDVDYEKLGSFGVKVNVWNVEDAIVIDKDCVYTQGDSKNGKRYVWVSEDGNLSKRYVTVGYLDGDVAWIVQGLSEGEQIVLEKLEEEAE